MQIEREPQLRIQRKYSVRKVKGSAPGDGSLYEIVMGRVWILGRGSRLRAMAWQQLKQWSSD